MVKFKGQKLKLAKKIKFQDVISQWMQSYAHDVFVEYWWKIQNHGKAFS